MRYAETGFNLEVDLTRGNIERVATDPRLTELHLGGLGTNARIMWDRVGPEVEPFDPENLLVFGTGLLAGTPAPGCNRTIVSTISPQTRLFAFSMMGGFWGPELKHAGYDKVVIRGKSPELVYLWIHDDKVEIRDAIALPGPGHARDRGAHPPGAEGAERRRSPPSAWPARTGSSSPPSSRAGPAPAASAWAPSWATRTSRRSPSAGRRTSTSPARRSSCEHCNEALKYIKNRDKNPIPGVMPILAGLGSPQEMAIHDEKWHTENFVWGNARDRRKGFWTEEVQEQWTDTMETMRTRLLSCHNCPMKCGASIAVDKRFCSYMMKCFSKLTYTMGAYVRPRLRPADRPEGHRARRGRLLGPADHGLRRRALRGRHPDGRGHAGIARRQRGAVLLAARQDRAAGRDRRRPGRRHLLGGREDRQGRGGVRPQQHQEDRAAARSSWAC